MVTDCLKEFSMMIFLGNYHCELRYIRLAKKLISLQKQEGNLSLQILNINI